MDELINNIKELNGTNLNNNLTAIKQCRGNKIKVHVLGILVLSLNTEDNVILL